ncbi:MAG: hypothetical protein ACRD0G_18005 [Acidimicrobiales bacterium]
MSEQPPAPGWWQASDGGWHPPGGHPDPSYRARWTEAAKAAEVPPAEAPPIVAAPRILAPRGQPPPSDARRALTAAAAVALLLLVGLVAYQLADGDETEEATAGSTTVTTRASTTTSKPTTTSTTVATTTTVPTTQQLTAGSVLLTLPIEWRSLQTGTGATGATMFPDDPAAAAVIDSHLATVTPDVRLFAVDPNLASGTQLEVRLGPSPPGGITEAADQTRAALGADARYLVAGERPLDVAGQSGQRFDYAFNDGLSPLQIVTELLVAVGADLYSVRLSTIDPANYQPVIEGIVASISIV